MKLSFECNCCEHDVPFEVEDRSDYLLTEDVSCPNCEETYTVEVYYEDGKYIGFQVFDYCWYMEHGDEDFTVIL